MLPITDETKASFGAYSTVRTSKVITIDIPALDLTITNNEIKGETLSITEKLESSDNVLFGGCNSTIFKCEVIDLEQSITGQYIEVTLTVNEEDIPLFKGYVDSVTNLNHEDVTCEITAYDILYTVGNKDVKQWYDDIEFPITIKDFRDSFFEYVEIEQEETVLPNDDVSLNKGITDTVITGQAIMKGICQINARYGIIGREGTFKYVKLEPYDEETTDTIAKCDYTKVNYEPYRTASITQVDIYSASKKIGTYGDNDSNIFSISDNKLTQGMVNADAIAESIFNEINGLYDLRFVPSNITLLAKPYLECGDSVTLETNKRTLQTYILTRTIKGIQAMTDEFESRSDQYFPTFKPSLESQIEAQNEAIDEIYEQIVSDGMAFYEFRNGSAIHILDNDSRQLLRLKLASKATTRAEIHIEVNLDVETNDTATAMITYLVNGEEEELHPEDTYIDGKHIMHLMFVLPMTANSVAYFIARLTMNGGSATIEKRGVWLYASGLGLVGDAIWDGNFDLEDEVEPFEIPDTMEFYGNVTEDVDIDIQIPISHIGNDNANSFDIDEIAFADARDRMRIVNYEEGYQRVLENEDGISENVRGTENETGEGKDIRYTEQEVNV